LISLWLEAKNSKRNEAKKIFIFFTWACKTHAKRISFRFVSLWSEKIFEAKPAHPTTQGQLSVPCWQYHEQLDRIHNTHIRELREDGSKDVLIDWITTHWPRRNHEPWKVFSMCPFAAVQSKDPISDSSGRRLADRTEGAIE
jgi:hypothetical protein